MGLNGGSVATDSELQTMPLKISWRIFSKDVYKCPGIFLYLLKVRGTKKGYSKGKNPTGNLSMEMFVE
jgi:hypothetical protein